MSSASILHMCDALTLQNDDGISNNTPNTNASAKNAPSTAEISLMELSRQSEANAIKLANDLFASLNITSAHGNCNGDGDGDTTQDEEEESAVPSFISHHIKNNSINSNSSSNSNSKKYSRGHSHGHGHGHGHGKDSSSQDPLPIAKACAESILHSLTKVASGGNAASSSLRLLETQRRHTDAAAHDIQAALQLRTYASTAVDCLGARAYTNAAKSVESYRNVRPSERATVIAGPHSIRAYERTKDVLERTVLQQYEVAVANGDLKGLSELTPLLGMLGRHLADKGVGLYLRYSQNILSSIMNEGLEADSEVELKQNAETAEMEEGVRISRAEIKRREDRKNSVAHVTVCSKLAKIFNVAVTHLRHHLPMVAFSLGIADGDAALVQLVNLEVEKRATAVIREYLEQFGLKEMHTHAERVGRRLEDDYLTGDGFDDAFGSFVTFDNLTMDHNSQASSSSSLPDAMDDCGFQQDLGVTYSQMNSRLDEIALLMQHSESYERFIRHAVAEVDKARVLRQQQQSADRKRQWMQKLQQDGKDVTLEESQAFDQKEAEQLRKDKAHVQHVLPSQTQLNEMVAEVGGYLSGLERTFLLAGIQRAFYNYTGANGINSYNPLTILSSGAGSSYGRGNGSSKTGGMALQTSVVEECLYAAQQSTLRAFATGHNGTAAAAANVCADTLRRVLLEALVQRAETGSSMLTPGDGFLPGAGGSLGKAAYGLMSTAQKGLSTATKGRISSGDHGSRTLNEEEERMAMKQRIDTGIARACATMNDLEVAVDYTRRLQDKLTQEMQGTFAAMTPETEQLNMCIKSLANTMEAYQSSSNSAMDQLISVVMSRVRSIVNECVGQESAASSGFSNVMGGVGVGVGVGGGTAAAVNVVKMNYELDDAAFELAQLSEGYLSKLCYMLDELMEPLRGHLAPRLADALLVGIIGGASKRLEMAIKRTKFTPLGALALDSDIRFFINFVKERVDAQALTSNTSLYKSCNPLARLAQIALLMNVDDLDDVLDLITSSKRKKIWDLTLGDCKTFLTLRVDFETRKVNGLLQMSD